MATFRALEATSAGIAGLLGDALVPGDFPSTDVQFTVVDGGDIPDDLPEGAGVLLYRVAVNGVRRHPSGRQSPDRSRALPKLPVDAHLLVLVSMPDATAGLALAGWILRTLEDHPTLPPGLLNRGLGGTPVFSADEAVELSYDDVSHEDLLRLWEVLGGGRLDALVLPYVARNLLLESTVTVDEAAEVQERLNRFGHLREVAT